MIPFAGYAVQAGTGHGADAATTPLIVRDQYRRQALEWMNAMDRRGGVAMDLYLSSYRDFAPVRDEKELARLPAAERAEWKKLWHKLTPITVSPRSRSREVAPPPRVRNP